MVYNKPLVIIILLFILLFLLILNVMVNKKNNLETFQSTATEPASNGEDGELFKNTHEFVEYSNNSQKLVDMFTSLKEAEQKCNDLEEEQFAREQKFEARENDRIHKELQEQDKKIHELKEIVKYLTIEKKRRDKINKNCMHNKQRKLNDNYNIVKSLAKDGFLRDNSIDLDLNISDSEKLKNFIKSLKGTNSSVNKEKAPLKCTDKGADYVDIDKIGLDKCYNCDADKLKKVEKYINKDFDN